MVEADVFPETVALGKQIWTLAGLSGNIWTELNNLGLFSRYVRASPPISKSSGLA